MFTRTGLHAVVYHTSLGWARMVGSSRSCRMVGHLYPFVPPDIHRHVRVSRRWWCNHRHWGGCPKDPDRGSGREGVYRRASQGSTPSRTPRRFGLRTWPTISVQSRVSSPGRDRGFLSWCTSRDSHRFITGWWTSRGKSRPFTGWFTSRAQMPSRARDW